MKTITSKWSWTKPKSEWVSGKIFLGITVQYRGTRRAKGIEEKAMKMAESLRSVESIGRSASYEIEGRTVIVTVRDEH